MPYIPREQRPFADPLFGVFPLDTSGKLNFAITKLCEAYREEKGDSYCTFQSIIGALECAKLEYYRRIAVPYEDRKMKENGDVYRPQQGTVSTMRGGDRVQARPRLGIMRVWQLVRGWWT